MFLKSVKLEKLPIFNTDILIIGSGIAGLFCALNIDNNKNTLIVSKTDINSGSTPHAQGGIAVVLNKDDTLQKHIEDTLISGCYSNNIEAVEILVKEGPDRIRDLMNYNIDFDKHNGNIHFTKEAAHSGRRILHSKGDAIGLEIESKLINNVKKKSNIELKNYFMAIDLLVSRKKCYGIVGINLKTNEYMIITAQTTVIATGGLGNLFRETTNPEENTGDGIAMAYRAGAQVTDMEFIQFHPTTLYIAGAPRFLISEAVRGEGAYLRNASGKRFMKKYDTRMELASRDIVSRSILFEMIESDTSNVFLDLSHLDKKMIKNRFPNIRKVCMEYGIDILKTSIPVRPSAHYFMGGIKTDINARTNISNLYSIGECSCNGVHGANRLASNSLLEGIVFGYRCAKNINVTYKKNKIPDLNSFKVEIYKKKINKTNFNVEDAINSLKNTMWRYAGIVRKTKRLQKAYNKIKYWQSYVLSKDFNSQEGFELQNMLILSELIVNGALWRKESRGAQYTLDYPEPNPEFKNKHYIQTI